MTMTSTTTDTSTKHSSQVGQDASEAAVSATDHKPPREGRAARRTFTAEFKRAVVEEYDAAPVGTKGSVLRRERLYDSHVNEWRAAIKAGTLGNVTNKKSSRTKRTAEQQRIAALEKQVAKLEADSVRKDQVIADREAALEVLGKGVSFLEALSKKETP